MLFNSLNFVVFFGAIYLLFLWLPEKYKNLMLLVSSYVFYGAWDPRFLSLIIFSTVVDYICGLRIHAGRTDTRRRAWLWLSVTVNLGLLGFFKYYNFFTDSLVTFLGHFGLSADPPLLNIILPVGISFYTFQTMSYSIDIYRRELVPTRNFFNFALFVAYFPQLVAGPIERAKSLLPQIEGTKVITSEEVRKGLWLVVLGYYKKVFVADNCAVIANAAFSRYVELGGFEIMIGVLAFTFQIYGDFSGYSDIARGISKFLGVDLMTNFRMPYFSQNPSEFWRRWHISLSSWLRDYVYLPLGGNRRGNFRTYINLMVTMLLGGLWHGARWNFVLWGAYQGGLLVAHRALKDRVPRCPAALNMGVFFLFTCYGWLLFRAESWGQIQVMTNKLLSDLGPTSRGLEWLGTVVYFNAFLLLIQAFKYLTGNMYVAFSFRPTLRWSVYWVLLIYVGFLGKYAAEEFIYFQF